MNPAGASSARVRPATSWRPLWVLVRKELIRSLGRPVVWVMLFLFLSACAAQVGYLLWLFSEQQAPPDLVGLARFVFLSFLIVVPILTGSALRDEEESGMLEVLAASPVPRGRLLASLVTGRLVLVGQFVGWTVPLFFLLTWVGLVIPIVLVVKTLFAVGLCGTLMLLFALDQLARGVHARRVDLRVALFVFATPFFFLRGNPLRLTVCLGIVLMLRGCMSGDQLAVSTLLYALFPFEGIWVDLGLVTPRVGADHALLASWGSVLLLILLCARRSRESLTRWLVRGFEQPPTRFFRPRKRVVDRASLERLASRAFVRMRAAQYPEGRGPVAELIYRAARQHPVIAMHWLSRHAVHAGTGLQFTLLGIGFIWAVLGQFAIESISYGAGVLTPWLLALLLVPSLTRLLPARRRARDLDLLLASPLTGRRLASGVLWVALLRSWPTLFVLTVVHALAAIQTAGPVPLERLFGAVAWLGLIPAVCLCYTLTIQRTAGRVVAAAITLFVLAQLDWSWLDQLLGMPPWVASMAPAVRASLAGVVLSCLLLAACCQVYDRFARR